MTLAGAPVGGSDAATKQYVDGAGTSGGGLVAGDIINRLLPATPSGYLKCNGAVLSKTTYSALYAVIGDTYNFSQAPGNGKPWRQQYAFNTQQSTDITGWTTGTSLPATVYYSQAIVTKNRVYLLGGVVNGTNSSTVYTAPFTGGTNDYLALIADNTSTQFKLPDYTSTEIYGSTSYIKT